MIGDWVTNILRGPTWCTNKSVSAAPRTSRQTLSLQNQISLYFSDLDISDVFFATCITGMARNSRIILENGINGIILQDLVKPSVELESIEKISENAPKRDRASTSYLKVQCRREQKGSVFKLCFNTVSQDSSRCPVDQTVISFLYYENGYLIQTRHIIRLLELSLDVRLAKIGWRAVFKRLSPIMESWNRIRSSFGSDLWQRLTKEDNRSSAGDISTTTWFPVAKLPTIIASICNLMFFDCNGTAAANYPSAKLAYDNMESMTNDWSHLEEEAELRVVYVQSKQTGNTLAVNLTTQISGETNIQISYIKVQKSYARHTVDFYVSISDLQKLGTEIYQKPLPNIIIQRLKHKIKEIAKPVEQVVPKKGTKTQYVDGVPWHVAHSLLQIFWLHLAIEYLPRRRDDGIESVAT